MFLFDPLENIRKPLVFCFQGDQKGTLVIKWLNNGTDVVESKFNITILPFTNRTNVCFTAASPFQVTILRF